MPRVSIAVVDDDASVRVALGRLLRLADYEVLAFASGEEFLAAIGSCVPACALLDVHLPGLSGIEVQRQLGSDGPRVPVVFITAGDDASIDRDALAAGGLRMLRKPFSSVDLLDTIASALDIAGRPR
jgi:FixJ family two-component response regulator